ncbi:MAG: TIGR00269 family protein [Thermoplasmata archaeon]|nr:TIGR00269 family protein [Thermoplasmata archaeon]
MEIIKINGREYTIEEYNRYFYGRVRSVMDKYRVKGNIAVALSGGKDSAVMLHVLSKFDLNLCPFYINIGIPEYSKKCMEYAIKAASHYGYEIEIINLADYGIDINYAKKKCSVCGTVRRYLMNKFAFENECDYVATGHNLSDTVTFALNNMINVNTMNMRGAKPVMEGNKDIKMVARLKPLYWLRDDEIAIYAEINSISYCKDICPYAKHAPTLVIKEWIHELEKRMNGSMINLAKSFSKIEDMMDRTEPRTCDICGYPSYGRICKFCKLRREHEKIQRDSGKNKE